YKPEGNWFTRSGRRTGRSAAWLPGSLVPAAPLRLRMVRLLPGARLPPQRDRTRDRSRQRLETTSIPIDKRSGGPTLAISGRVRDLLDVADRHRPGFRVRPGAGADAGLRRRLGAGRNPV